MTHDTLAIEAGQRISVGFDGLELDDSFIEILRRYKIGNIILFSRNLSDEDQIGELTSKLDGIIQSETGYHPFIMIDEEGGAMSRLPQGMPNQPSAETLGKLDDIELTEQASYLSGRNLISLGINMNLAPSADVNTEILNPVIGVRSYSSDSNRVSQHANAAVKGYMKSGVLPVIKHFPGHGDTRTDSHRGLPVINRTKREMKNHMKPFLNNPPAIMTGHLLLPDMDNEYPASLSRIITHSFLRQKLGYNGLIVTDCLEMNAVGNTYGTVDGALLALNASADIALISHHPKLAAEVVTRTAESYLGAQFNEDEWRESIERIKQLKHKYLSVPVKKPLSSDEKIYLDSTALKAVSIEGDIPISENPIFIAPSSIGETNIGDNREDLNAATFLARSFNTSYRLFSPEVREIEKKECIKASQGADTVFIATYAGYAALSQIELVKAIAETGINTVHISLLSPVDTYLTQQVTTASITTYEYSIRMLEHLKSIIRIKEQKSE